MFKEILNSRPNEVVLKKMIESGGACIVVDPNCEVYIVAELLYALNIYYKKNINRIYLYLSIKNVNYDIRSIIEKLGLIDSVFFYSNSDEDILSIFMGADCFYTSVRKSDKSVYYFLAETFKLAIVRVENIIGSVVLENNILVIPENIENMAISLNLLADGNNRTAIWK